MSALRNEYAPITACHTQVLGLSLVFLPGQKVLCPLEGGRNQPRAWKQREVTHHGTPADAAQVVEESFGMVDCGLEMSTGRQPLSVQVLPSQ